MPPTSPAAKLAPQQVQVAWIKLANKGPRGELREHGSKLEKDTGVICLEMMRKIQDARFKVVEVPVHHYHRAHGKSQFFNFSRIFRTGVDVLRLWYSLVVRKDHLKARGETVVA